MGEIEKILDFPVLILSFNGNVKKPAMHIKYIAACSFEGNQNKAFAFVKIGEKGDSFNRRQRKKGTASLINIYSKIGKVLTTEYRSDGIDAEQVTDSN